jgi:hypothetical protein
MPPAAFFRGSGRILVVVSGVLTLLSACVSGSENPPPQSTAAGWVSPLALPPSVAEETYFIGNYQGRDSGEAIPEWANRYLEDGVPGIERMDEFKKSYVFVAEISGVSINALSQWALGFSPEQDISYLVARRVQARFSNSDTGSPDFEYGRYFENLVRASADTFYHGVEKRGSFWFEKEYPGENDEPSVEIPDESPDGESSVFLILMTIDKDTLRSQLEPVLASADEDIEVTREQMTTIDHLRSSFFEGF